MVKANKKQARFTSFSLSEDSASDQSRAQKSSALPELSDLTARLRFFPHEGQVWLDDQRAVVLNLAVLIAMRRELVETLGPRKSREILFRMGHVAGTREAQIARKVREDQPQIDAFMVGPQLHALRGEVLVEPVVIEADVEAGHYYSELIWRNSSEAEAHVACFGGSSEPVCSMQLGYASGYTSAIMERPILFRETECIACGDATCRIVGKPIERWPDETSSVYARPSTDSTEISARGFDDMPQDVVGSSPGFLGAWYLLKRVASMSTTVLLQGETGVGKELFARALHQQSPRGDKQLFTVNCAAIPEGLVDSELFGVEKGAFTGANRARAGWFEAAEGSTLFLDEIGTLNIAAQAKLLRVIQEGQVNRVGGTTTRQVDVRLVCATNLNLEDEVRHGNFRLDLLHRLNVFPIHVPSLRDRRDDIPPLIQHFLDRFNQRTGRKVSGFTQSAVDALFLYQFPGNVRELENMIERAAILTLDEEPIETFHLFHGRHHLHKGVLSPEQSGSLVEQNPAAAYGDASAFLNVESQLEEIENIAIREAMAASNGNVSAAARKLGLTRSQLRYRLRDKG